jgi:hypothetical protein
MRQVTVAGGNLFKLAAYYLGDPTKWDRIATANHVDDIVVIGVVQFLIPVPETTRAGVTTIA